MVWKEGKKIWDIIKGDEKKKRKKIMGRVWRIGIFKNWKYVIRLKKVEIWRIGIFKGDFLGFS